MNKPLLFVVIFSLVKVLSCSGPDSEVDKGMQSLPLYDFSEMITEHDNWEIAGGDAHIVGFRVGKQTRRIAGWLFPLRSSMQFGPPVFLSIRSPGSELYRNGDYQESASGCAAGPTSRCRQNCPKPVLRSLPHSS